MCLSHFPAILRGNLESLSIDIYSFTGFIHCAAEAISSYFVILTLLTRVVCLAGGS